MHEWTTTERRRLGELLSEGFTYAQAAVVMGMPPERLRGAARRFGFTHPERQAWHSRDWSAIDPLIVDCIERGLSVKQTVVHLNRMGVGTSYCGVYRRLKQMPKTVQSEARANGLRRIRSNAERMRMRQHAA